MTYPLFFSKAFEIGFRLPNFSHGQEYYSNSSCIKLNGKRLANHILSQAQNILANNFKVTPKVAVILVGDNVASKIYVKNKIRVFEKSKLLTELIEISAEEASDEILIQSIEKLNLDPTVHGILVQLPLPKHLNTTLILSKISPHKDVDGFSIQNIGLLALNQIHLAIPACTPFGIMTLLTAYGISVKGKNCVVVGRSRVVGKPMGLLLLNENATVTYLHSHSKNLDVYTKEADILIVAAGKKHLINEHDVKSDAVVIDVGMHRNDDGTLSGDVHPDVRKKVYALTPVPKGVGPMTIAALLINTICAAQSSHVSIL